MNQDKTWIEEYEINRFTMLIRPVKRGKKVYSEVFELQDEFIAPDRPTVIVDKSCKYFGSSFQGRVTGTKQVTRYNKKVPITIDPTYKILFMPTSSPTSHDCTWISLEHVIDHKREESDSTRVLFRNHSTHIIPMSHSSFITQLERTSHLQIKLKQRHDPDYR
ncbi:transcriptional regulator [Bacillus sp. DNRA2]|uniref:competence protein ComK n=1 Tax=Bacillus sp. DNRA2 TaxID=2723053 RepID=UPI00145FC85F|nr:competence protein ComK [Bacillus sp. DNRA2]NMD70893.1 transcriptional regulator [Bacillus sp. DNRA2]